MKFENTEVWGFKHAIRAMRNPMNSWDKSDSGYEYIDKGDFVIGENDLHLMQGLIKAGSEHRKFMRQIFVSVDITASLYWWKEFETYKVGTVSNSCSTMHKLASTPITRECFEMDDFENIEVGVQNFTISEYWSDYIECLEKLRQKYNKLMEDKKHLEEAKKYWKELIRLLPESWLQKRTITMSYENVLNMVRQRKGHKLTEWSEKFMEWARSLPYAKEFFEV